MAKRTMKEIEKDYKRIRTVVDTTPVTSIKEIANAVGLTNAEVKTSLAKHPRVEEKIMAQLVKNKEELKAKKKAEKEVLEDQKRTEQEAENHQKAFEPKKKEMPEEAHRAEQSEETADFDAGFVIDASITCIEEFEDVLSKLCATKEKIILTSITIKELEKMQKFNDVEAMNARHILAMAAENQKNFHSVLIDEKLGIPDDCIIKYCADHKDKVSLLTSDKTMALKARMYGVQTQYFKHRKTTNSTTDQPKDYLHDRRNTLFAARKVGDKLYISNFKNDYRSILLISNGFEYMDGTHALKIGDDVYLATKKPEYMTFAHYQITSLSAENNCELIYSKRIYKATEILNLPKASYKSFMRDFKS